jgi:peptidase E
MSRIVAMGGGGFVEEEHGPMHGYLLSLASSKRPRICLVATGKGDDPQCVEAFYGAFVPLACEPTHLALFDREVTDLMRFVLAQDIILVWGGNTASMLAVWRAHGLDQVIREAAAEEVVLAGACAGALAWFEDGVTDSFGGLDPLRDGLGLLSGSLCPYYNAEPKRRPTYHRLIASGEMQAGTAIDAGVALRYQDGRLEDAVAQADGLLAYRVSAASGNIREEKLVPRVL